MCGITGCYFFSEKHEDVSKQLLISTKNLRHRGPDQEDTIFDGPVFLGHTRLSIIDLTPAGNQPMRDEQGEYILVYNGECYNYRELRQELRQKGHNFRSDSDTEVILHLLIEMGPDGLQKVNGFFSLAFFNRKTAELILARDRFGIKPLYYYLDAERLLFASEIKAILPFKPKLSIDKTSLNAYLHLNYIPSPHTIYREVKKIMPGTFQRIHPDGNVLTVAYYNLEKASRAPLDADPIANFSIKMEQAVKKRLVADVPLGAFLSGGLDSSVVTGIASKFHKGLKTFTMVFKDHKYLDESHNAALVAKKFRTDHHELEISNTMLLDAMSDLLKNTDDPFADSSSIALYCLCKMASQHIKVALSGDGGDELLAGYRKHRAFYNAFANPALNRIMAGLLPIFRLLPQSRNSPYFDFFRKLNRYASAASLDPLTRYWNWAGYQHNQTKLLKPAYLLPDTSVLNAMVSFHIENFNDVLSADLKMVLEGDMLVKTDRMSMAHSLEVRVPFLDHKLVETVHAMPGAMKYDKGESKVILRRAFGYMLPREILTGKKQGFEVPLRDWLRNEAREIMNVLLNNEFLEQQGIFNPLVIEKLLRQLFQSNSSDSEQIIWNLMIFNSWWKNNHSYLQA